MKIMTRLAFMLISIFMLSNTCVASNDDYVVENGLRHRGKVSATQGAPIEFDKEKTHGSASSLCPKEAILPVTLAVVAIPGIMILTVFATPYLDPDSGLAAIIGYCGGPSNFIWQMVGGLAAPVLHWLD